MSSIKARLAKLELALPDPEPAQEEMPHSERLLRLLRLLAANWGRHLEAEPDSPDAEKIRWEYDQFQRAVAVLEEYQSLGIIGAHIETFASTWPGHVFAAFEHNRPDAPDSPWKGHWPWQRNGGTHVGDHLKSCLEIDKVRSKHPD